MRAAIWILGSIVVMCSMAVLTVSLWVLFAPTFNWGYYW